MAHIYNPIKFLHLLKQHNGVSCLQYNTISNFELHITTCTSTKYNLHISVFHYAERTTLHHSLRQWIIPLCMRYQSVTPQVFIIHCKWQNTDAATTFKIQRQCNENLHPATITVSFASDVPRQSMRACVGSVRWKQWKCRVSEMRCTHTHTQQRQ